MDCRLPGEQRTAVPEPVTIRAALRHSLQNSLLRLNIIIPPFLRQVEDESPLGPVLSGDTELCWGWGLVAASCCSVKVQGRADEVHWAPAPSIQHCEALLGLVLDILSAILSTSECWDVWMCLSDRASCFLAQL